MKIIFRKFISKCFRTTEYVIKNLVIVFIHKLTFEKNNSLTLTFDSNRSVDGTGAQLQRIISIYALAKYFGLNLSHLEIRQVAVHPLDPFQTEELYDEYLTRLNRLIVFEDFDHKASSQSIPEQHDMQFWRFMFLLLINRINQKHRVISIFEPYPITEFRQKILVNAANSISVDRQPTGIDKQRNVVIHYRQGVGGFALYPGQNIARETPLGKFEVALRTIFSHMDLKPNSRLIVLTDAPTEVTHYVPPIHQQDLWEGTPGYSHGIMTIQPIDFGVLAEKFSLPVEVIRGGNPIDAIKVMAQAEILLMSKSSLSYVGGYLNRLGQVYYPKDFWHRPMPWWKSF